MIFLMGLEITRQLNLESSLKAWTRAGIFCNIFFLCSLADVCFPQGKQKLQAG